MRILILADDLTGANDTAIQFVKRGFSALVVACPEPPDPSVCAGYEVVALNSDTRNMSRSEACDRIRNMLVRLKPEKVYKKVDSVLRGNPGAELAAVMDELDLPLAVAAPSFPVNRSVIEGGILKSGGGTNPAEINAVTVFAESRKPTESIPLDIIRRGCKAALDYTLSRYAAGVRVFVADAVSDDDLETVYRMSAVLEKPHILAGAAGLANQVARLAAVPKGIPKPSVPLDGYAPALVIAGTRQGETADQIVFLSQARSVPVIRFKSDLVTQNQIGDAVRAAYQEAAEQLKKKVPVCIIAVESMFKAEIPAGTVSRGNADCAAISAALGVLAGRLMEDFLFPVIITTGGDTSLEVCRRLGAAGIRPFAEICPGIPIGCIVGGRYENRYIITKSGRFGNEDALTEILRWLGV
ncbi:MAG: hypothetical protein LBG73_10050 [Spirochaetaceae bacterium]|jgi:uncharacterized protein YgbK (DUF1537 family)|nr:hypothetical protein [Spirochaetaceae bacterium]